MLPVRMIGESFQALVCLAYVPEFRLAVVAARHQIVLFVGIEINVAYQLTVRVLNHIRLPWLSNNSFIHSSILCVWSLTRHLLHGPEIPAAYGRVVGGRDLRRVVVMQIPLAVRKLRLTFRLELRATREFGARVIVQIKRLNRVLRQRYDPRTVRVPDGS